MIIHISTLAVTYVDDLIGQILDALVQSDLADNTIVTLIGDHGWTLGENREWSKFSNYKTATRVPWLMHIPSSRGPKLRHLFGDGGSSFDKENDKIFLPDPSHRRRGISEEASNLVITKPIQLLDLFPTLVHKTGLPRLKKCNKEKKARITNYEYSGEFCRIVLLYFTLLPKTLYHKIVQFQLKSKCFLKKKQSTFLSLLVQL